MMTKIAELIALVAALVITSYSGVTVITFPARTDEITECNQEIFNAEPFEVVIDLPDGWTVKEKSPEDTMFPIVGAWSAMGIYTDKDVYAGAIAYNVYEEYEGAENNPQAIYCQIALANHYQFIAVPEAGYTPVKETESGVTAITKVYYSKLFDGKEEKTNYGILSYNKDLHVYIACELDPAQVSEDELTEIAESVVIRSI